jgi:hypothetical protein
MNHAVTNNEYVEVPLGVTFEVPNDYARFCQGRWVRILPSTESKNRLCVSWSVETIAFSCSGKTVAFDRAHVLGLIANLSEDMSGMEACTLRIGVVEPDGTRGLLPIFSASPRNRDSLKTVVDNLSRLPLPCRIFQTVVEMLEN